LVAGAGFEPAAFRL